MFARTLHGSSDMRNDHIWWWR